MRKQKVKGRADYFLFGLIFLFILFGLVMIGDVSLVQGAVTFDDKFYFLKKQIFWAGLGTASLLFFSKIDYHLWKKYSKYLYLLSILFLGLVFLPQIGVTAYGAKRWLNFGFINFQPVELAKLGCLVFFAHLSSQKEEIPLGQQLIYLAVPIGLILLEPDLGSSVLLVSSIGLIWFLSQKNLIYILGLAVLGLAIGSYLIFSSPYRKQRVMGMFDPFYDPQGESYHVYQLALTLGSGGLFGQGMGNSRQKFQYLPETTTDSIMAMVGEEFGFIGLTVTILIFALLIWRCLKTARLAPDDYGQLLAAGITGLIAFQGLINLGAITITLPLTGMPFPFVSYGGSSLISLMSLTGILLNISKFQKPRRK
jgi:cell division protein FtsW